jgi:Protein of unknown function (DUF3592)
LSIVIGIVLALAGGLAALAGWAEQRRVRQLRQHGIRTWAMVVARPAAQDEADGARQRRTVIQFSLADGQVIEQAHPGSLRKAARLQPGQQVMVWYDAEDPRDVLVYGRGTRLADAAFIAVGTFCILVSLLIVTWDR